MSRVTVSTTAALALGGMVAGCQTAPVQATYGAAATGAGAVKATGGELYLGAGAAIKAPLRDLNMMQDKIAPVLLRAESHPYDLTGVNSCSDVLDRVAELDLALGPDVDTPKASKRTRVARGADFAASTALDAAGSAAEHFIPMRGTIKQLSGAARYENHVKHAALAGTTRRSFLKAVGMEHSCVWPAAPLDFRPTQVADAAAPWTTSPATSPGQTGGEPVRLASTIPAASATSPVSAPSPRPVQAAAFATVGGPSATMAATGPALARGPAARFVTPVSVPVSATLVLPPAAPRQMDAAQTWRPAASGARIVQVSTTTSSSAAASASQTAAAPWSGMSFAGSSGRP